jgi:uroporphyrinogen-III synthase
VLEELVSGRFQIAVVQTGAGATALFSEAERLGMLDRVRRTFARTTIVCRGPKPLAVLKRHGLHRRF